MVTYKQAGVDIAAGDKLVERIQSMTKGLNRTAAFIGGLGGFGGAFALPKGYKQPVLISGTDGVGTKLKLAFLLEDHATVGIDLVAMCVNDIITCGAKPLFFLDYFATGKLSVAQGEMILRGVVEGCKQSNCVLLGGETAEMPGFYREGEYDLAGFAVGIVERSQMIDGARIKSGDLVLGIPSSGLHSNGFSLVRGVLTERELVHYGKTLLTPTRIYVPEVTAVTAKKLVKGIAHITGGGLPGNVPRILPKGVDVVLDQSLWQVPDIFSVIQKKGQISKHEMFKVFNMGIGMVLITSNDTLAKIEKLVPDVRVIGEVVKGSQRVRMV